MYLLNFQGDIVCSIHGLRTEPFNVYLCIVSVTTPEYQNVLWGVIHEISGFQTWICVRITRRACWNTDRWTPFQFLIQWLWRKAQEFALLASSQVTLVLLVQGQHFDFAASQKYHSIPADTWISYFSCSWSHYSNSLKASYLATCSFCTFASCPSLETKC